jgi:hypothetical protein
MKKRSWKRMVSSIVVGVVLSVAFMTEVSAIETRKYPDWVMHYEKTGDIIEGSVTPYSTKHTSGNFTIKVDSYRWKYDKAYREYVFIELNLEFERLFKDIGPLHWRKRIC